MPPNAGSTNSFFVGFFFFFFYEETMPGKKLFFSQKATGIYKTRTNHTPKTHDNYF